MLLAKTYQDPEPGTEASKAMGRAETLTPWVAHLYTDAVDRESFYLVKRRDKISTHVIKVWVDPDKQIFIECPCYRGRPPIDAKTKLPAFEPMPCIHAASVLLFIAHEGTG